MLKEESVAAPAGLAEVKVDPSSGSDAVSGSGATGVQVTASAAVDIQIPTDVPAASYYLYVMIEYTAADVSGIARASVVVRDPFDLPAGIVDVVTETTGTQ